MKLKVPSNPSQRTARVHTDNYMHGCLYIYGRLADNFRKQVIFITLQSYIRTIFDVKRATVWLFVN